MVIFCSLVSFSLCSIAQEGINLAGTLRACIPDFIGAQRSELIEQTNEFQNSLTLVQRRRFISLIDETTNIEATLAKKLLTIPEVCKEIDALPVQIKALFVKYADIIELYQRATGIDFSHLSLGMNVHK